MGYAYGSQSMCQVFATYKIVDQELVVVKYTCGCAIVALADVMPEFCPYHAEAFEKNKAAVRTSEYYVGWGGE